MDDHLLHQKISTAQENLHQFARRLFLNACPWPYLADPICFGRSTCWHDHSQSGTKPVAILWMCKQQTAVSLSSSTLQGWQSSASQLSLRIRSFRSSRGQITARDLSGIRLSSHSIFNVSRLFPCYFHSPRFHANVCRFVLSCAVLRISFRLHTQTAVDTKTHRSLRCQKEQHRVTLERFAACSAEHDWALAWTRAV